MKRLKLGLIVKFTVAISTVLVLSVFTLSFAHVQIERLRAEGELKNKGTTLARNLAYNSEYGILSGNTESLNQLVKGVMDEDVVYVQVLDAQGKIIAGDQRASTEARLLNIEVPVISWALKRPAEEIGLEPLTPVKAEQKESRIGTIKLGISLARVNLMVNQLLGLIWGTALAVILAGVLVFAVLTRVLLIGPLKKLLSGTQKIAQGDLVYRVKVESRDEIGELASSFNVMTVELSKAQAELTGYTKELEKKVAERTQTLEKTVSELQLTTTELSAAKTGLEKKVAERTAELEKERVSLEEKIKERTKDLSSAKNDLEIKLAELEEFHDLTVGRELKMIELEKEIDTLLREFGREPRYQ